MNEDEHDGMDAVSSALSGLFANMRISGKAAHGTRQERAFLTLGIAIDRKGAARPTLKIAAEVLSAEKMAWCEGHWTLHVFATGVEARACRRVLGDLDERRVAETGSHPSGYGLLLVLSDPFAGARIDIVDQRHCGRPLMGSWQMSDTEANDVANLVRHAPDAVDRSRRLVKMVLSEIVSESEMQLVEDNLCRNRKISRRLPSISVNDVHARLEELFEGSEGGFPINDVQIMKMIDERLERMDECVSSMIDQIALEVASTPASRAA